MQYFKNATTALQVDLKEQILSLIDTTDKSYHFY